MPTLTEHNARVAAETLGLTERPKESIPQLRAQAIRAVLHALTGAAQRDDHAAVADLSTALKALSDAIV